MVKMNSDKTLVGNLCNLRVMTKTSERFIIARLININQSQILIENRYGRRNVIDISRIIEIFNSNEEYIGVNKDGNKSDN